VTVGPDRNFGCYFIPVLDEVSGLLQPGAVRSGGVGGEPGLVAERRRIVSAALGTAAGHVLDRRAPDAGWTSAASSAETGLAGHWRSAFVASVLAAEPLLGEAMEPALRWLRATAADPVRSAEWDEEVMALAVAALTTREQPDPAVLTALRAVAARAPGASPEALAAVLSALVTAGELAGGEPFADELLHRQRGDGGWAAARWTDALATTADVTRALAGYAAHGQLPRERAPRLAAALLSARTFVRTRPTYEEPFLLGAWLSAWVAAGGTLRHPSVDRILKRLVDRQQPDGRWPSTPARHLIRPDQDGDGRPRHLYVDDDDVVVTAVVIRGLSDVLRASPRRE
jgi:hypothetical protein